MLVPILLCDVNMYLAYGVGSDCERLLEESLPLYRRSSSVPSGSLLMPHFLNESTTVSVLTLSQAFFTHWQTWDIVGFLMKPDGVWSCCGSLIYSFHSSRMYPLKGLFIHTSRGCCWLVNPPGNTATFMFKLFTLFLVAFVKWALNWSHTRSDGFLIIPQDAVTTLLWATASHHPHPSSS